MQIKVCGMRNADNIVALCKLPINYIGFIFYHKSPRFVGETFDPEIANLVPPHIIRTGVFVNATAEYIIEKIERYKLGAVQLHGSENAELCSTLKKKNCIIIKAFGVDETFDFSQLEAYALTVDFFLFDTKSSAHGGTGQKFDWSILLQYKQQIPLFLSGGIGPADTEILQNLPQIPIQCLDLNSKFEAVPALKDIALLSSYLRKINIIK